jgi:hypothetical protein
VVAHEAAIRTPAPAAGDEVRGRELEQRRLGRNHDPALLSVDRDHVLAQQKCVPAVLRLNGKGARLVRRPLVVIVPIALTLAVLAAIGFAVWAWSTSLSRCLALRWLSHVRG